MPHKNSTHLYDITTSNNQVTARMQRSCIKQRRRHKTIKKELQYSNAPILSQTLSTATSSQ